MSSGGGGEDDGEGREGNGFFWLYNFGIFFAFFCYTRQKYKNVCYTVLVIPDLFQKGWLYIFVIHGFS